MKGVALAVLAAVLMTVGCGGGSSPRPVAETAPPPETTVVTTTTEPPVMAPLTGLPLASKDRLNRPVLAVKVENSDDSRPQTGFQYADVVYEAVVEGGITRFILLVHSKDAALVGPIRSARPVDRDILVQFGKPILAFAGGIPAAVNALADAGVTLVTEDDGDSAGLRRRDDRWAPHNLYAGTADLRSFALTKGRPTPPPNSLFSFIPLSASAATTTLPAPASVLVDFSDDARMTWMREAGSWYRYDRFGGAVIDEEGEYVSATNVLILSVDEVTTGNVDVTGAPVPSWELAGSGALTVLLGNGRMVNGTWERPSPAAPTVYRDSAGQPIMLNPGTTWVQLLPSTKAVVAG